MGFYAGRERSHSTVSHADEVTEIANDGTISVIQSPWVPPRAPYRDHGESSLDASDGGNSRSRSMSPRSNTLSNSDRSRANNNGIASERENQNTTSSSDSDNVMTMSSRTGLMSREDSMNSITYRNALAARGSKYRAGNSTRNGRISRTRSRAESDMTTSSDMDFGALNDITMTKFSKSVVSPSARNTPYANTAAVQRAAVGTKGAIPSFSDLSMATGTISDANALTLSSLNNMSVLNNSHTLTNYYASASKLETQKLA